MRIFSALLISLFLISNSIYAKDHKQHDTTADILLAAKKIFQKNGKFVPVYNEYITNQSDYEKGFHDGMHYSTTTFLNQGTNHLLQKTLKEVNKESRDYACGFYSALESYYAISSYIINSSPLRESHNE
ncbi:hypothetical protein [Neptunomonas concharum]|uniref:Uncharacterized protein n=1 Tax=Neptunomonas concharum TaxID=1031538 RepID=A0A5P1RAG7_9GAMM|nr:hypothetical protein [Neptunomonas concharum]QEQ96271.1 hypothetical protein F0U83_05870 [Neptunomonas concharum]